MFMKSKVIPDSRSVRKHFRKKDWELRFNEHRLMGWKV